MTPQFRKEYEVHFFGKSHSLERLRTDFPQSCFLKQTHSDILTPANSSTPTGDAHWTQTPSQSLVIQTADCLPVMLYLPQRGIAVAIHAGWRGVENRIVTKSLKTLQVNSGDSVDVLIGPHIQQTSFEVDEDVAISILKAHEYSLNSEHCEKRGTKFHINLSALVIEEIQKHSRMTIENSFISQIDTKTHPEFFSFRDGDRGGRNYSVINKKSAL